MHQAFVMQLFPGVEEEYKRRHDELWPDLHALLKAYGIANYHIFLHPETLQLFGSFDVPEDFDGEALKREPVMLKWWDYMAPLMATHEDSPEPQSVALRPVFYMA